jgi:hypothetical protein
VEQQALKLNFKQSFFVPRGTITKTYLKIVSRGTYKLFYLKNVSRGT